MRIENFQNIPAVLQALKSNQKDIRSGTLGQSQDPSEISLSAFAETLQTIQREAMRSAPSRQSRVEELGGQIQNNTLDVNLEKLAERMVDLQLIDFEG